MGRRPQLQTGQEGEELTQSEIVAALRKGTIDGSIVPVLCGSAFKNKGVQPLLDAVVDYLPAPPDVPAIQGTSADGTEVSRHSDDDEPFSALAFKIMSDPYGRLTFIRVYSGVLTKGSYILNSTKNKKERISRLIILKADDRIEVDELRAGYFFRARPPPPAGTEASTISRILFFAFLASSASTLP